MVSIPETLTKPEIGGDVIRCQAWNGANQAYDPDTDTVEAVKGHWIYRSR